MNRGSSYARGYGETGGTDFTDETGMRKFSIRVIRGRLFPSQTKERRFETADQTKRRFQTAAPCRNQSHLSLGALRVYRMGLPQPMERGS